MCTFHTFMVCNCVFYMKIALESKESRAKYYLVNVI